MKRIKGKEHDWDTQQNDYRRCVNVNCRISRHRVIGTHKEWYDWMHFGEYLDEDPGCVGEDIEALAVAYVERKQ